MLQAQNLPDYDFKNGINYSPHVVILGAGASVASFPNGDKNGKILPLMENLAETLGIKEMLIAEGIDYKKNFEEIYNELHDKTRLQLIEKIKKSIIQYFSQLKIPDEITIYDKLVLSLREKDLIASFNWDPLLLQAYCRNGNFAKLPKIVFLHGNVLVGICQECKVKGILGNRCSKCKKSLEPTELLYPIKEKNYDSNSFIEDEWNLLRKHLQVAYFVTMFGYSAPKTDVAARDIMKTVWDANKSKILAEIEVIHKKGKEEEEVIKPWEEFIVSHHYQLTDDFHNSYLTKFPRRSCESLAETTLQCRWIRPNPISADISLKEFRNKISTLIDEERSGKIKMEELQ